jgi:hypothetical protein
MEAAGWQTTALAPTIGEALDALGWNPTPIHRDIFTHPADSSILIVLLAVSICHDMLYDQLASYESEML